MDEEVLPFWTRQGEISGIPDAYDPSVGSSYIDTHAAYGTGGGGVERTPFTRSVTRSVRHSVVDGSVSDASSEDMYEPTSPMLEEALLSLTDNAVAQSLAASLATSRPDGRRSRAHRRKPVRRRHAHTPVAAASVPPPPIEGRVMFNVEALEAELRVLRDRVEAQELIMTRLRDDLAERGEQVQQLEAEVAAGEAAARLMAKESDQKAAKQADLEALVRMREDQLSLAVEADKDHTLIEDLARQLKADNERLLQMLCSTKEFAYFLDFVEDSGGVTHVSEEAAPAGGVAYYAGAEVRALFDTYGAPREGISRAPLEERHAWLPEDAVQAARSFARRHVPGLSDAVVRRLLRQLNGAWSAREERRVKRLKQQWGKEKQALLDKMANMRPYDDVVVDDKIARLKQQLRKARERIHRLEQRARQNPNDPDSAVHLAAASLQELEEKSARLRVLEHENAQLRHQVQDLESHTVGARRGSFLKGVTWLGTQMLGAADGMQAQVADFVSAFQEDTIALDRDDPHFHLALIRKQGVFLDKLDTSLSAFRTQMARVFDEALAHS